MAMDGVDMSEWLALGFEESGQDASHQPLCRVCQREAEHFTIEGQPYCQAHYEQLPLCLRCDALALESKEAALQKLVEQFQRDYPGKVMPYDLLRVATNFPGRSVSVEPAISYRDGST